MLEKYNILEDKWKRSTAASMEKEKQTGSLTDKKIANKSMEDLLEAIRSAKYDTQEEKEEVLALLEQISAPHSTKKLKQEITQKEEQVQKSKEQLRGAKIAVYQQLLSVIDPKFQNLLKLLEPELSDHNKLRNNRLQQIMN